VSVGITIDSTDLDSRASALLEALSHNGAAPVKRATDRAVRKTTRWVRRQISKIAASELGMAQKTFDSARIRVVLSNNEFLEATVWVGTNPMGAHKLGSVRWTRRMAGARAGRRLFAGSFSHGGNRSPIFERVGSERLPLRKVTVEVDRFLSSALSRLESRALSRYRAILAQELNYELQKVI